MALFELVQDYVPPAEEEWTPPTFKDCAAREIDTTFFNDSEFAELHNVDGVDALVVWEDEDVREHSSHWEAGAKQNFDTGLYASCRIMYIKTSDYGEMPLSGDLIAVDEGTENEQFFRLKSCEEEGGVYRMVMERTRQG